MSVPDSKAQDSSKTLKFSVNGAQDVVEKIENANIFSAKMGQKVVKVSMAEGSVSITSLKSGSNDFDSSRGPASNERDSKSATEIVDIALARHLEVVALESLEDDSLSAGPKGSPKIAMDMQHDEKQRPTSPKRTPTPLQGNLEAQTTIANQWHNATSISDLVMIVCFRSTPEVGQPAFPYNGAVFPLHFGCTVVGRGKLQCVQHGSDMLIEIPHNSVSKRHAKIGELCSEHFLSSHVILCLKMLRGMVL
jgi:hypothetical protein